MKIILDIKQENYSLRMEDGKKCAGEVKSAQAHNLSATLLKNIEKLLRNCQIDLDKISGYKIISDVPNNWTTCRIAKITFESLMIAGLAL